MFGNNTYWWAGWLMFAFFAALNLIIYLLRNKPALSFAIAWTIAVYIFVYKVGELIFWQILGHHYKFPVEFSAVSYYAFGIFVTFRWRKADTFPIFAAVLTGTIYSMFFWISPDSYVNDMETPYLFTMAILNHHLLYFAGMLLTVNVRRFSLRYWWQHLVGLGLLVGYSWLIYGFTNYGIIIGKPIIIQITDGTILNWLFKSQELVTMHKVYYGLFVFFIISFILTIFYTLSHSQAKKRIRNKLPREYYPASWRDTYRIL